MYGLCIIYFEVVLRSVSTTNPKTNTRYFEVKFINQYAKSEISRPSTHSERTSRRNNSVLKQTLSTNTRSVREAEKRQINKKGASARACGVKKNTSTISYKAVCVSAGVTKKEASVTTQEFFLFLHPPPCSAVLVCFSFHRRTNAHKKVYSKYFEVLRIIIHSHS